ncbi:DUF3181 family protein [Myxosarcina sp. GI1]|uniref:DUF3181 family protein n=1 Tax=Myxosarcina sp. GI1 TaxID=1541065 RepID=UPI000562B4AD|nr:DUF3181 family protein [Myxosarcina sp. GI1]
MASTKEIETLAAQIGENIYIDVAKWHLYLADAHLHTTVAERAYSLLEENSLSESTVSDLLKDISVKLGGGKKELSLSDLIPASNQRDLLELLENYQQEM